MRSPDLDSHGVIPTWQRHGNVPSIKSEAARRWPVLRSAPNLSAVLSIPAAVAMALPPKVYQFLVGLFASLGSLLYGYDLGVIAQVISSPAFNAEFKPTDDETGAVVSVFTGGAFFGAFFAGPAGDRLGRRLTILIGALVRIVKSS